MKKFIIKFLGLDKIQQELESVKNHSHKLEQQLIDIDWTDEASRGIDYDTLSGYIDENDVANCFDTNDIASRINASDIAYEIDTRELAEGIADEINYSDIADNISEQHIADCLDMDDAIINIINELDWEIILGDRLAETSSDAEEDTSRNISMDAVESMIDAKVQQFADSLEVMVSAKLNINK
jgi:hypothetical protein